MIHDEELFFARRLGYGLKQGEAISGGVRDWAVAQISEVPPLDFYGSDGKSIRSQLPDYAEPVPGYEEATRLVGFNFDNERIADQTAQEKLYPEWREALLRSLTAVNGPSPVFERFWAFWVNHFAVKAEQMTTMWYGPHTRLIRSHMTGKFAEMLRDAELQPAMLYFLDNVFSTGPHSPSGLDGPGESINENQARELFELHTMSPEGGYTQADVIQAAYALTGWSFYDGKREQKKRNAPFGVYWDFDRHEPGPRTIMGKKYGTSHRGQDQAPQLIADLAAHPATAQFISWKLIRHFVADDPPADSVARVRDAWMQSGGDLKVVHTAVIDEVIAEAPDHEKFSNPETWLHQMHRTASIAVPLTRPRGGHTINILCDELGQGYAAAPQPNGYPDRKSDWISKELLERRARYAYLASSSIAAETVPYLHDFAIRLAGKDSDLVAAMQRATKPEAAATILLASPQFMRI
ncbi:MAG: DUF1800 family protein [Bauldia sp.]